MYDIEIKDLSVYYGSVCALQNINLKVKNKEFLGIIGPNGGGKTTLLKVILKLIKPSAGWVSIRGNTSIGYVPQFTVFNRHFPINVLDVILMGKLPKKIKWFQRYSAQDKKHAEEIMGKLGLLKFKDRQIGQLSGGQLQKVLIARALVTDPEILILDEPTANIDAKARKEIYEMLKKLNEDITILIVSHSMEEIFLYLDSVVYINRTLHYHEKETKLSYEILEKVYGYPANFFIENQVISRELKSHREGKNDRSVI